MPCATKSWLPFTALVEVADTTPAATFWIWRSAPTLPTLTTLVGAVAAAGPPKPPKVKLPVCGAPVVDAAPRATALVLLAVAPLPSARPPVDEAVEPCPNAALLAPEAVELTPKVELCAPDALVFWPEATALAPVADATVPVELATKYGLPAAAAAMADPTLLNVAPLTV